MRSTTGLLIVALLAGPSLVQAHPVPKDHHDRTIVVHLEKSTAVDRLALRLEYVLEVDETTVVLEDMKPFRDEVDFARFKGNALGYYREYMRRYAPILAERLLVRCHGRRLPLTYRDEECHPRLIDPATKEPLGHLRCEFTFRGDISVAAGETMTLEIRENNFLFQAGQIRWRFANAAAVEVVQVLGPSEALQHKPGAELSPQEAATLRDWKVLWQCTGSSAHQPAATTPLSPPPSSPPPTSDAAS
ncbi:MAG: hypothetical protein NZO58_07725, partial [Gemmataceae bacterium]|nr:hypothetical protein [Gemmataceae bacterium]